MDNINEYEKQRLENIRKNQEKLKELNLLSASLLFEDLSKEKNKKRKRTYERKRSKEEKPAYKRITRNQAKLLNINVNNKEEVMKQDVKIEKEIEEEGKLVSAEEYFPEEIKKEAIIVDGHFDGWINPELIEKYHFEKSAKEAWDNNGGGKYSHKNPLGEFKEISKTVKPRNWSSAKYVASKLFQKNPNAYFYRHLEPGLTQNIGDWDDEEKELFLKIAKKYGCGDKWGIFSSYIPKRVGYQCANYYRQVIIPEGLIFDPNYKFSKWGKAIYCGSYNNKTKKNNKSNKNNDKENTNNNNNKQKKVLNSINNEQIVTNNNEQKKNTNNNEQIKNSKTVEIIEIMDDDTKPQNYKYSLRKRKPRYKI